MANSVAKKDGVEEHQLPSMPLIFLIVPRHAVECLPGLDIMQIAQFRWKLLILLTRGWIVVVVVELHSATGDAQYLWVV